MKNKIDRLFRALNTSNSPGCTLAVIRNREVFYQCSYGMADLEHTIPLSAGSVFEVGSVSKQFTAMSVILLARQGKLSLDDEIQKYLPELSNYSPLITIRHLIHHTSGIRDYLLLMESAGMRFENWYSEDEAIDLIARQEKVDFKPGDKFKYSNTGYFLLAQIVKRISGTSLRIFADQNIFEPLGMRNSYYRDDFTMVVKNRAIGYSSSVGGSFRIHTSLNDFVGDGGLYTTADDLFLWDTNFYQNTLGGLGNELIEELLIRGVLNNGTLIDYACGLYLSKHKGLAMISHEGAWMGYRADMIRFPEVPLSVICLANLSTVNVAKLTRQIADIVLEN